jgi:ABC-type multidrug transport system ATPase subunit
MVSTPYMDEAVLCERIALIQQGRIMSVDTPRNITDKYPKPLYAIRSGNMSLLLKDLRKSNWVSTCYAFGEYHHITFNTEDLYVAQTSLIQELQLHSLHSDIELNSIDPTIEDCFIHLMN